MPCVEQRCDKPGKKQTQTREDKDERVEKVIEGGRESVECLARHLASAADGVANGSWESLIGLRLLAFIVREPPFFEYGKCHGHKCDLA